MEVEWSWIWAAIGCFGMCVLFSLFTWAGETQKIMARRTDWRDRHIYDPSYIKEEGALYGTYIPSERDIREIKDFNSGLGTVAVAFFVASVFLAMIGVGIL